MATQVQGIHDRVDRLLAKVPGAHSHAVPKERAFMSGPSPSPTNAGPPSITDRVDRMLARAQNPSTGNGWEIQYMFDNGKVWGSWAYKTQAEAQAALDKERQAYKDLGWGPLNAKVAPVKSDADASSKPNPNTKQIETPRMNWVDVGPIGGNTKTPAASTSKPVASIAPAKDAKEPPKTRLDKTATGIGALTSATESAERMLEARMGALQQRVIAQGASSSRLTADQGLAQFGARMRDLRRIETLERGAAILRKATTVLKVAGPVIDAANIFAKVASAPERDRPRVLAEEVAAWSAKRAVDAVTAEAMLAASRIPNPLAKIAAIVAVAATGYYAGEHAANEARSAVHHAFAAASDTTGP
jgi:hypothetical protein